MNALDRVEAIRAQRIILVSHRPDVSLKVNGSLGEANMSEVVYGPVLDYLADHKPRTIEQLEQAIQQKGINFAQLVEVIMVLAAIGHIAAVQDDAVITKAKKQTDRVNHYICKKARGGNDIIYLASPVTGGGVQVTRFQQLFLLAIGQGKKQPGDWTEFTWQILSSQGQRLIIEGKTLETADDNIAELSAQANSFAQKELPILRALQVA